MRAYIVLVCTLLLSACAMLHAPRQYIGIWVAVAINGRPVIAQTQPSVTLREDGVVAGSTGCNAFGGRYEVADGRLATTDIEQTIVSCGTANATAQEIGAQENAFMAVLAHGPRLSVTEDNLVLTAADGATVEFARR